MARQVPPAINLPDRQQFDGTGPLSPDVCSHHPGLSELGKLIPRQLQPSASDEYQHALEVGVQSTGRDFFRTRHSCDLQVVFDPHNAYRRKSSLVAIDAPAAALQRRTTTECYVHALLEGERWHGGPRRGSLENIAEQLSSSRIESGMGASTNADSPVEATRGDDEEDDYPGQEDQRSWRENHDTNSHNGKERAVASPADGLHSRLLTKKQLSDMAWGVRELSKRLGSIRLKMKVKSVFLLTKAHDETLIENTREVSKWLLSPERDVRYTVWVEDSLKENRKFNSKGLLEDLKKVCYEKDGAEFDLDKLRKRLRYWKNDFCKQRPHTFDFVVTLGGDGTVLYASYLFQRIVPPVLSFALGSLGFLTKFDYADFEQTLTKAFRDGVTISLRLRFEGTVMRSQKRNQIKPKDGENMANDKQDENEEPRDLVEELVGEEKGDERTHRPDGTFEILNDIVVDRGPNPS